MHKDVEKTTYRRTGAGRPAECAGLPGEITEGVWKLSERVLAGANPTRRSRRWPADSNAPRIPPGRSIGRGRNYASPSGSSAIGVI